MQIEAILQYGEFIYAAAVICVLVCLWIYIRLKVPHPGEPSDKDVSHNDDPKLRIADLALTKRPSEDAAQWWNHEDFPYSAPFWLRYPVSIAVFAVSHWAFFEWEKKAGWVVGVLVAIMGLGLVRELFFGILLALIAGLVLWALGAAVAALPVSVAILIGAIIIANAVRR
jgi:hypothetical protein